MKVKINGKLYHAIPNDNCTSYGVNCSFHPSNCNETIKFCDIFSGAPENRIFLDDEDFTLWLAAKLTT